MVITAEKVAGKSGIRLIAEQAGVSIATVSRVLNGSPNVSESTRASVMRVVASNRYRPNAAAKALATRRTHTIAAVIPTLEHSIFAIFMNALEDELALAGYSLVIATHRFNYITELQRCNEVLKLGAEAIIVSGTEHDPQLLDLLGETSTPCLFTSVYAPGQRVPSLGYDNRALSRSALNYLADLGHRRINVLHGPVHANDRMRLRLQGVQEAAAQRPALELTLQESPISAHGGSDALRSWQQQGQLPDACLCLADVFALGVLHEASRLGIRVPEHLSVMGFEDVDWAAHSSPRLTTVALPAADMGKAAAIALVNHLDLGIELQHQKLAGEIVERESTRRCQSR